MTQYQVLARKYRPKTFHEVLGQDAIVTTLKNAMKSGRLAHAYLFCGSRGTGKTTLARILAKALNCADLNESLEPCNACSSCKEIAYGNSLDVLEIDGASHRGIDDVRQINDTVGYAASSGKYKVYIIDEVHMLTKEAFNALLKTLEEPPENVKFLFATTEPHKVLPTILSRCQRFNLNRIPVETIARKLRAITQDLNVAAEEEALHLIAKRAEGGLRDAESLLDQIFVFHEDCISCITAETVASVLGIVGKDILFELDSAGKEGRFSFAFDIAHQVFSQGKDLIHFVESLIEHFRNLLLVKLSGIDAPFLVLSESERGKYEASAKLYTKEQCFNLIEYLIGEQNKIRYLPSPRIALESILLHIMRVHNRLPIEYLVKRLTELESKINAPMESPPAVEEVDSVKPPPAVEEVDSVKPPPVVEKVESVKPPLAIEKAPPKAAPASVKTISGTASTETASMSIDPSPTSEDLGIKKASLQDKKNTPSPKVAKIPKEMQSRYDTLMHFAAVELEGIVQKGQ